MTATATSNSTNHKPTVRPMRILYIATEMGLGGAEVVARTLFNEWAADRKSVV